MDKGSMKLQNAVSDIEDRHNDIMKLEKVINYLKFLFYKCRA
jgi:t-SNARE complex subunit (syntaxin)